MPFTPHVRSVLLLVPALCVGVTGASWAQAPAAGSSSPSFVVAPFETDRTGWMPPPRLGDTLAELLTSQLTSDPHVHVVDASWLPASAAPSGSANGFFERALQGGVDYVVLGAVTRLSMERHASSRAGFLPVPVAAGLVRKQKTETVIGLSIRVVDTRTGRIVGTASAQGGGEHQKTSGGGLTLIGKLPIIGGSRSSASGVQDRLIDEAVQEAIGSAAVDLAALLRRVGAAAEPVSDAALP